MSAPWRLVAALAAALIAAPALGQGPDPRSDFVNALGRFSLAINGAHGDEEPAARSSLDDMQRALEQWDALVASYEAAMAADVSGAEPPLAARMHLALGGVYLDRHRIDAARREFTAARALDPSRADIHFLLASMHSQVAGDSADATEAFRTAAALEPDNPIRAYVLARHLARAGMDEEAVKTLRLLLDNTRLQAALDARTAVPSPFIRLALVPEAAGVEPYFPPARYASGFAHLRVGEFERAIASFREALSRDPLVTGAGPQRDAVRRAAAAIRDGDIPAAVEQLKSAIAVAPDEAEPHRILGAAYAIDQQYDEAIAFLREAIRLDAGDERARIGLAEALIDAGELAAAQEALQDTLMALPGSGRARYTLARLYQRQGRHEEALREFQAAVKFEPLLGLNGMYETMGALHVARQEFDEAVSAYSTRVDLHPNDPDAHYDLGDVYLRQGRHEEALVEFSIVLLLDPAHATAAASIAQAHLRNASYADAAAAARRALEHEPASSEARYVLGTALIRLGRAGEGKQELETFQQQQAELAARRAQLLEVEGLRRDATVNAADGKHEETVALLRRVVEIEPSYVSHLELGLALLDAGEPAEAVEHFNTAGRLGAPYELHRYLAAAYQALGRTADSQRELAAYERIRREALRRRSAGGTAARVDGARDRP